MGKTSDLGLFLNATVKSVSVLLLIEVVRSDLGDLLLGDGEPDLTSPRIQLLDGEMLLLHGGQRSIVGELCEDLGDVRTPVVQKVSLAPFLLSLHFFQFGYNTKYSF